jgi:hypothetical protein
MTEPRQNLNLEIVEELGPGQQLFDLRDHFKNQIELVFNGDKPMLLCAGCGHTKFIKQGDLELMNIESCSFVGAHIKCNRG